VRSLRARLFGAIGLAVIVAVTLSLVAGAVLVHRSVQHEALASLGRQADLLAQQQRTAPPPAALGQFLATQQVRMALLTVDQAAELLPPSGASKVYAGEPASGTVQVGASSFLYQARIVNGKAIVLLRASSQAQNWSPYELAFLVAGLVGLVLAALGAFVLARAISRPISRVADASRALAVGEVHGPLAPEGPTEVVALAEAFNYMAEELAQARNAERTFLLSVSHELKTPLTAITGHAEALGDGVVPPERVAEVILRESKRLERLVRDLLDLARIDAHVFGVHPQSVDLAELADEAAVRFEPQARAFGVELAADARRPAPAVADHDRVLQVLSNLIENALRITPEGGSVTVHAEPGTLTVADTGPGLAEEDVLRAFERFYLYERSGSQSRTVGTGLGLAIVRELTEAMGGSVGVESRPGAGTTFTVSLPHDESPTPAGRRAPRSRALRA
jgi:two-component system, OmpR family, sensor kinase